MMMVHGLYPEFKNSSFRKLQTLRDNYCGLLTSKAFDELFLPKLFSLSES